MKEYLYQERHPVTGNEWLTYTVFYTEEEARSHFKDMSKPGIDARLIERMITDSIIEAQYEAQWT